MKRKKTKTQTKPAGSRPPRDLKTHDPSVIGAGVMKLYRPLLRGLRPDNGDKRLYIMTLGTLAATKLMLMLDSLGNTRFDGKPGVWQNIEDMSDDFAKSNFEALCEDMPFLDAVPGVDLTGKPEYLRTVKGHTGFSWSEIVIADDEPMPGRLSERLVGTQPGVDKLLRSIMTMLGERRRQWTTMIAEGKWS